MGKTTARIDSERRAAGKRLGSALAVMLALMLQAGHGTAVGQEQQRGAMAWDGFLVVDGILNADGTWNGCVVPGAKVLSGRCIKQGMLGEVVGMPEKLTPQVLLDRRIGLSLGVKRAQAVGVLPHWKSSSGKNPRPVLASDEFVIVYKVVDR